MSLSRNHDPVTQDNPQTLLWAFSCRNYFQSAVESTRTTFFLIERKQFLHEIAHNKVCGLSWVTGSWFLERDTAVELFICTKAVCGLCCWPLCVCICRCPGVASRVGPAVFGRQRLKQWSSEPTVLWAAAQHHHELRQHTDPLSPVQHTP